MEAQGRQTPHELNNSSLELSICDVLLRQTGDQSLTSYGVLCISNADLPRPTPKEQ